MLYEALIIEEVEHGFILRESNTTGLPAKTWAFSTLTELTNHLHEIQSKKFKKGAFTKDGQRNQDNN